MSSSGTKNKGSLDALGRVFQQSNANGNTTSFYIGGTRTETVDPAGDRHVTYQTSRGKVLKDDQVLNGSALSTCPWQSANTAENVFNDTAQCNGVVNVSANRYDGQDRLTLATAPEGGTVSYTYSLDLLNNVTQTVATAKPGSALSPLTTTYSYDPTYNKPTVITDPLGLVATNSYDGARGNLLTSVADSGGSGHFNATARFTYNAVGQVVNATDPLGAVTHYAYDGYGNPVTVTRDYGHLNQVTSMTYNALGDMTAMTDPNGNVTASSYDADRRVSSVTLPAAPAPLITAYSYDQNGQLLQSQQSASGAVLRTTSTTYTLTGNMATATDANGNVTRYAYDTVDRLSSVTDAVGRVTSYGYDALSRRIAVFNPAIQSAPLQQTAYTPDGLSASLTDANSHSTTYAYDGFDRLATGTYPDSSTETYSYDADSNVLTRKTRKGDTITLTYDTLNRLSTKAAPSEATVTYAYDLNSHVIGVSDTSAAITAPSTSASYLATATYDPLNRPVTQGWSPTPTQATPTASSISFTHSYDATNRRVGQTVNNNAWLFYPSTAGTTSYTANNLNQYSAINSMTPTYDGNGNLTYDGTYTYAYDAESRLTGVTSGGTAVAAYAYDAQGRRKSKTVGSAVTIYVTDADNHGVLDYNGTSGAQQNWYAFGPGPDAPLNQMNLTAGTRLTMIPDIQGSIQATLDSGSGTLTPAGYLPYGGAASNAGTYRYTGQRIDPETGLYYYKSRMYSTAVGRFYQADTIGYAGGVNLYEYGGSDPLNATDPTGTVKDIANASGQAQLSEAQANYQVAIAAAPSIANGLDFLSEVSIASMAIPQTGGIGGELAEGLETLAAIERDVAAYDVGTFNALKAQSVIGDSLDIHHVVQGSPAEQIIANYSRISGPSIALPQAEHQLIPTISGQFTGTARDLLATDIRNLRNFTNAPNISLQQLIELNKSTYPAAFGR